MTEPVYLVWKNENGRIIPRKVYGDQTTGVDKNKHNQNVLKSKKLSDEAAKLSIDELTTLYPYEENLK